MNARPKLPPKPTALTNNNSDNVGPFSVSAAKALFEAAKKPEVRNAVVAAAKNPYVRATAKNVAKDEKARNAVINAVNEPSSSNKFSAATAIYSANKNSDTPPPPPPKHNRGGTSTNSSSLFSSHSSVISALENLHMGGSSQSTFAAAPQKSPQPAPPPMTSSYQSSSSSYTQPVPPPVPKYNAPSPAPSSQPHAYAKYSFNGTQQDEMTCTAGDRVLLKRHVDDQWIFGENESTRQFGIVPFSFLDVVVPLTAGLPPMPSPPKPSSGIYATAMYDYESYTPGDLQFRTSDSIRILNRVNDEWLEGELNGFAGIFPSSFVDCPRVHEVPYKQPQNPPPAPVQSTYTETRTAAYDYSSGVSSDLQFKQGDTINVVEVIDSDWIMGELYGQRGLVPINFLVPPGGSLKKSPPGLAAINSAFSPKKALAIGDYHSDDPKHLYVTRGDTILVVEDVDEYYYKGKLEAFKTLPAGIFPKNVVQMQK